MCPEMLDNVNDASSVDGRARMWGMANNQCLHIPLVIVTVTQLRIKRVVDYGSNRFASLGVPSLPCAASRVLPTSRSYVRRDVSDTCIGLSQMVEGGTGRITVPRFQNQYYTIPIS